MEAAVVSRYYPTDKKIENYRRSLSDDGYLFVENLPDGFDHLYFAQEFGRVMQQYDGSVIWPVKADPQFDTLYHSRNTQQLMPHTECYEFNGIPPKYLVLWCVSPAHCGGGQTMLYDTDKYFNDLDPADLEYLKSTKVTYNASSGIQKSIQLSARHTVLTDIENSRSLVRFSRNCMDHGGDDRMEALAQGLVDTFERDHFDISWNKNDLLIWDNQRMLHNRSAFADRSRELHRLWMSNPDQLELSTQYQAAVA